MFPAMLIAAVSGDVLVPVLGAILVALITAVTTDIRLNKQLAHDRELKDVEELRKLLDEAALLIAEASKLGVEMRTAFIAESVAKSLQEAGKVEKEAFAEALGDAHAALRRFSENVTEATDMEQRVALRLGQDHEVTVAYVEARRAAADFLRFMVKWLDDFPLPQKAHADASRGTQAIVDAQNAFLDAALPYVGSRFRDRPGRRFFRRRAR